MDLQLIVIIITMIILSLILHILKADLKLTIIIMLEILFYDLITESHKRGYTKPILIFFILLAILIILIQLAINKYKKENKDK